MHIETSRPYPNHAADSPHAWQPTFVERQTAYTIPTDKMHVICKAIARTERTYERWQRRIDLVAAVIRAMRPNKARRYERWSVRRGLFALRRVEREYVYQEDGKALMKIGTEVD